jgi:hypothetical protein
MLIAGFGGAAAAGAAAGSMAALGSVQMTPVVYAAGGAVAGGFFGQGADTTKLYGMVIAGSIGGAYLALGQLNASTAFIGGGAVAGLYLFNTFMYPSAPRTTAPAPQ